MQAVKDFRPTVVSSTKWRGCSSVGVTLNMLKLLTVAETAFDHDFVFSTLHYTVLSIAYTQSNINT